MEDFLGYPFEGLIFGGAYFRNFTVIPLKHPAYYVEVQKSSFKPRGGCNRVSEPYPIITVYSNGH